MCNIIILQPGQMPVESDLYNMCYNNWHSYGLVTVIDDKLSIVRKVPTTGEVDPKEVYDLLVKDRQYTRYLHVRHNTAGATSLENTHPFDVYYSESPSRQVVFMHNGTLYDYKTTTYTGAAGWKAGAAGDNDTGDSDTKKFTEDVLQQLAPLCNGDFSTPTMVMILKKFWPTTGNRGLIISNDLAPIYLGDWKERKDTNGGTYKTANLDYFDSVTRGPQKSRIEEQKRKEEEERKKTSVIDSFKNLNDKQDTPFRTDSGNILQLPSDWPFSWPVYQSVYHLKADAKGLVNEIDFWERANSVSVGALTHEEIDNIYSDKESCIALMCHIFNDYSTMYDELCSVKDKHENATRLISELKTQISILENNRIIN